MTSGWDALDAFQVSNRNLPKIADAIDLAALQMVRHAPLDPAAFDKIRALSPVGADDLVRQVVEAYLKAAQREWARFEQGLADGDAALLANAAHALKSSSFNVGANVFASLCKEVEQLGREGRMRRLVARVDALRAEWQRVEAALQEVLAELPS